jgi:ribosomal protein L21E
MTEFKIGDRVRIVKSPSRGEGRSNSFVGDLGTIEGTTSSPYYDWVVALEDKGETVFKNDELELVVESTDFKIGDRVKIVSQPKHLFSDRWIGRIGTIANRSSYAEFDFDLVFDDDRCMVERKNIVLVGPTEKETELDIDAIATVATNIRMWRQEVKENLDQIKSLAERNKHLKEVMKSEEANLVALVRDAD